MSKPSIMGARSWPVSQWPATDQAGWVVATQGPDPLNARIGRASRWKDSTLIVNRGGYGIFLDWHAHNGGFDSTKPPHERIDIEVVTRYWQAMQKAGLASYSVAGRIQQLGSVLDAIDPDHDWKWVRTGAYRLQSKAEPVRDIRRRIQPAEDVLALGRDMMDAAENDRYRTPVDRATLFRDGLLISMFTLTTLRLGNLGSARIGEHLIRCGNGWRLSFDPLKTKTGRRIECSVPQELVQSLERYIDHHRKVLLKCSRKGLPPTDALWVSQHATAMTGGAIALQIKARTGEVFAEPINPHTFRHIGATTNATSASGHADDIMAMLGHSTSRTAEKHYNKARMVDAGNRLQETVDRRLEQYRLVLD